MARSGQTKADLLREIEQLRIQLRTHAPGCHTPAASRKGSSPRRDRLSERSVVIEQPNLSPAVSASAVESLDIEEEREITVRMLRLVNAPGSCRSLVREAALLLREWSRCDAVGIRLQDGEDYPYFQTENLSAEYVLVENRLCAVDRDGQLLRDADGRPVLECMCGNVIRGRFDPALPYFTANGSFWTNSTTELLASAPNLQCQGRIRNRCINEGYESVALVPLRTQGETLGLLQMNDHRTGRFTSERIGLLERLAEGLAMALGQHQTAERLRESEERFRRVFDASPLAMALGSEGRRIRQANPRMCELLGYSREELVGKTLADITHPEDYQTELPDLEAVAAGRTDRLHREVRLVRKDGSPRWVRLTAAVLERNPLFSLGIVEDIHEGKVAEEKLQQMQSQLAHVARLSTLGEMVAQIVHEVSQPLYSILNYAKACQHLLEKPEPDLDRLRDWNHEIAASAALTGDVLRKMRNFVRRGSTQRLPMRIEDLVQESIALLSFEFRQHEVAVNTDFRPELRAVEIDPLQIQQVLVNLLRNAIEALHDTHNDSKTVWISAVPSAACLELIVEDNGPGLPDTQVQLFEPFVTTKSHGLGMGLPISRTILEAHGGRLWACPSERGGAAFHFTLPWYEGEGHGT